MIAGRMGLRRISLVVVIIIIAAGLIVGLLQNNTTSFNSNAPLNGNFAPSGAADGLFGSNVDHANSGPNFNGAQNIAVSQSSSSVVTISMTTVAQGVTTVATGQPNTTPPNSGSSTPSPPTTLQNSSGFIEFFSNVTLQVASPSDALSRAGAIAYSFGGYLAYSSYNNYSSIAVLRIPAPNYENALNEVQSLGNLTGLESTSNDVTIRYTDLNATLQSLFTEEASLLKLENQSTELNETLIIESQTQGINAQINEIESQILQTRLLIDYSTITVTFDRKSAPQPFSLKLTATPQSGMAPLGVTLAVIVSGGAPPYIILYNFGDGSSYEGQNLIHTFYSSGTYNVTATATDSLGNAKETWLLIHVSSPISKPGYLIFFTRVGGLFLNVVEGIVEVAVVVVPIVLVVAAVVLPFRNRLRSTKSETKST